MNPYAFLAQAVEQAESASALTQSLASATQLFSSLPARLLMSIVFVAMGLWLLMPGSVRSRRWLGIPFSLIGLALLWSFVPLMSTMSAQLGFWLVSGFTIMASVATITARNPIYSAIWFAVSLMGVAALFLLHGAQFLGVATVAVYAGAIVVTFLFVIMLAQPEGMATYDRISCTWAPSAFGVLVGAVLIGLLGSSISRLDIPLASESAASAQLQPDGDSAVQPLDVLHEDHMAHFGGQLFSRHLVAVEVAGVLLLVALVGAVAIASHGDEENGDDEDRGDTVAVTSQGGSTIQPSIPASQGPRTAS